MNKLIVFGALLLSTVAFASNGEEKEKKSSETPKEARIDECCERTVSLNVFIEEWNVIFTAHATAKGCVESETRDDPRNMDVACGLAQRSATAAANRIIDEEIAEYRP